VFQIDLKSRKSIYEQVVDNIKDLIITGVIKAEDKIPSVRELSKILTVNPNTVQKAYRELEYQGFLYTVSGLGTFVASKGDIQMNEKKSMRLRNTFW
jgi:GntR family transcriptional regulator